jgi:DNA-directed RNA polymerase subunit RPC12/RpoP
MSKDDPYVDMLDQLAHRQEREATKGMTRDPMKCGNCGCKTATLALVLTPGGSIEHPEQLEITCTECKSTTIVKPTEPKLSLDWGAGKGIFCGGWFNKG